MLCKMRKITYYQRDLIKNNISKQYFSHLSIEIRLQMELA